MGHILANTRCRDHQEMGLLYLVQIKLLPTAKFITALGVMIAEQRRLEASN